MAGGMDVHKNKYIEDWSTARENLEKTFRFTRRNIAICVAFGIIVPVITHQAIKKEFRMQDEAAGRVPHRYF